MKQKTLFNKPTPTKEVIAPKKVYANRIKNIDETKDPLVAWIERRQRQLLVHSYIYYELNKNVIDDTTFDSWAKELVQLRDDNPDEFAESEYSTQFSKFDGSTGMDLPYKLPWVIAAGDNLIRIKEGGLN